MSQENEVLLRDLALSLLNQRPVEENTSPPEVIITYRKHEDYEKFLRQIAELQEQLEKAKMDLGRMSMYVEENFILYDQLRRAYREMSAAGMDTRFMVSVRRETQRRLK